MKKLLICMVAVMAFLPDTFAQKKSSSHKGVLDGRSFYKTPYRTRNSGSYGLDSRMLSLGYGFGTTLYNSYGYYPGAGNRGKSAFGPLMVKYEHAIRDEVGIGAIGELAFRQWKYRVGGDTYKDRAVGVGISFLGYYHFNKFIPVPKLDVYAGAGISIAHTSYKDDFYGTSHSTVDVMPAGVVGARYLFKPTFGVYGEVGRTSFSWLNLGVSFKL
jgi:hypothetical protein